LQVEYCLHQRGIALKEPIDVTTIEGTPANDCVAEHLCARTANVWEPPKEESVENRVTMNAQHLVQRFHREFDTLVLHRFGQGGKEGALSDWFSTRAHEIRVARNIASGVELAYGADVGLGVEKHRQEGRAGVGR
jgi:hypothetical protein